MKRNELNFIVDKDLVLSEFLKTKLTKKFYKHLKFIKANVLVNGIITKWYLKVKEGDKIKIIYEEKEKDDWPLYDKKLNIIYEDEHYLVCYKEHNILTIPTKSEPISLFQQIKAYLGNDSHISFLNRLDKETSGLLLVAKDTYSANLLNPVKDNIKRKYYALVEGYLCGEGVIDKPILKSSNSNIRLIDLNGKEAITYYKSLSSNNDYSLVELILKTGRTHQIRVHLKSIGHPIIGDRLYGCPQDIMRLQSYYLEYICPYTNEKRVFITEVEAWNEMKK